MDKLPGVGHNHIEIQIDIGHWTLRRRREEENIVIFNVGGRIDSIIEFQMVIIVIMCKCNRNKAKKKYQRIYCVCHLWDK